MSSAHATGPALGSSMTATRVPPESSAPARISTEPPRRNSPEDRSPSPSSRHDGGMNNTLLSSQFHMCRRQWSHQSSASPDYHSTLENFNSLSCRPKLLHRSHCRAGTFPCPNTLLLCCPPSEERSAERDGTHVGAARGSRRDEPRDGVLSEEDGDNEEPKMEGKGNLSGLVGNIVRVTIESA